MIDLYTCFDEMKGLYGNFTKHSETLEDHHDHMRAASTNLVEVIGWKKNNKEKPHGLPILEKLQDKKTNVSIETWEGICDSVET